LRKRIHRPSPALAISLIALFVALGGTGYAAVVINGKNLKNKSVAGKKLKNKTITGGKVKGNTLGGAQINESKLGKVPSAEKATSASAADHATSADTAANATSLGGAQASGFLRSGALQSGQTLTGAYVVAFSRAAGEFTQGGAISFPIPLSEAPDVTYLPPGSPATAECPGTASNPLATPGRLCVYGARQDAGIPSLEAQSGGRTGFRIFPNDPDAGSTQIDGTWAVTGP
jgi:hypothetical protein